MLAFLIRSIRNLLHRLAHAANVNRAYTWAEVVGDGRVLVSKRCRGCGAQVRYVRETETGKVVAPTAAEVCR